MKILYYVINLRMYVLVIKKIYNTINKNKIKIQNILFKKLKIYKITKIKINVNFQQREKEQEVVKDYLDLKSNR